LTAFPAGPGGSAAGHEIGLHVGSHNVRQP
jgi:hypothetical protein